MDRVNLTRICQQNIAVYTCWTQLEWQAGGRQHSSATGIAQVHSTPKAGVTGQPQSAAMGMKGRRAREIGGGESGCLLLWASVLRR
jgi:hypothetical protein